jgi:FkbM family methyltransferase
MANVLLDLGTHYGQGLREFIGRFSVNDSWTVHTWEANPVTYDIFVKDYLQQTPYVIHHNQAITDHNGSITVNIETPPNEGETGQGTSVIDLEKWNPWNGTLRDNFKTTYEVPCIDFSQFIKDNFSKEDNIIVKMDIEGSEYATLEKMLADGTLEYLNHISVEWHSRFFTNQDEMRDKENMLIDAMQKLGVNLESWK